MDDGRETMAPTKLTWTDLEGLPELRLELLDGDLHIGGVWYGHEGHARALLELLKHPPAKPSELTADRLLPEPTRVVHKSLDVRGTTGGKATTETSS
jgi:hypothetical protein